MVLPNLLTLVVCSLQSSVLWKEVKKQEGRIYCLHGRRFLWHSCNHDSPAWSGRWIFWWHWRHKCCMGGMDVQIISLEGMHSHPNCLVSIHLLVIILMMFAWTILEDSFLIPHSLTSFFFFLVEFYMPPSQTATDVFVTNLLIWAFILDAQIGHLRKRTHNLITLISYVHN